MAQPGRRRPLSLVLLTIILLVFAGAAATIFFTARRPVGSIPRRATIASLASTDFGYAAGTSKGLFVTRDGSHWSSNPGLPDGPVAVGSTVDGQFNYAAEGKTVYQLAGFDSARKLASIPKAVSALAVVGPDVMLVSSGAGDFFSINAQLVERVSSTGGPPDVLAVGVPHGTLGYELAGGLSSGLWRSQQVFTNEALQWSRILQTPVTAIVVDPNESQRVLIGTPAGILVSRNGGDSWQFTEFRESTSGLTTNGTDFFTISNRLLYRSPDGEKDWVPLVAEDSS